MITNVMHTPATGGRGGDRHGGGSYMGYSQADRQRVQKEYNRDDRHRGYVSRYRVSLRSGVIYTMALS